MSIDWSTIEDGLGSAEAVPALVDALASRKKAERTSAFVALSDERLVHQGCITPAAPLAVPLLAQALAVPKHPGRPLVLATLMHIAVGTPALYARRHPGLVGLPERAADPGTVGEAFRAVHALAPLLARHLGDAEAGVRAAAAAALVMVDPSRATHEIATRIDRERDEAAWIASVLALGLAPSLDASVAPELPALPDETTDAMRAAHTIARAQLGTASPEDLRALERCLDEPLESVATPFGALHGLALGALLGAGAPGRAVLAEALAHPDHDRRAAIANALVLTTFPGVRDGEKGAPLVSSRTLSSEELDVVRRVVAAAPRTLWGPVDLLGRVGLTYRVPDLRRFVGLDAPGPLERFVPWRGGEVEVCVVLDAVARDEIDEQDARAALVDALDPRARVEVGSVAADSGYGLHDRPRWTYERSVAFAASLMRDPACLPVLREHAAAFERVPDLGRWALLDALVLLAPDAPGVDLAPLLRALAPTGRAPLVAILRSAVSHAPASVRDTLALETALPDTVERSPKIRGRPVGLLLAAWDLLDLAADRAAAARRAARAVASWTGDHLPSRIHPVEAATRVLTTLAPESTRAIEEALPDATDYGRAILTSILPS